MPHHVASGKSVEASGRTVELAVEAALARLGRSRDAVEVKVLREGSRGVLGFGAQEAIVRVTELVEVAEPVAAPAPIAPTPVAEYEQPSPAISFDEVPPEAPVPRRPRSRRAAPPAEQPTEEAPVAAEASADAAAPVAEATETAVAEASEPMEAVPAREKSELSEDELIDISRTILLDLLQRMGILADVLASWAEPEDDKEEGALVLDIIGDDLGLLIGRHGETLRDLQYILRLLVGNRIHGWTNIVVDVEGYKQRRERTLRQLAQRTAERVIATGRPTHLEPMSPYERRIIHIALREIPEVETRSTGEGEQRKVGIFLKEGF